MIYWWELHPVSGDSDVREWMRRATVWMARATVGKSVDKARIAELEVENARLMAMVNGINKGRFTEEEIRAALPATFADCLAGRSFREHLARHLKESDE